MTKEEEIERSKARIHYVNILARVEELMHEVEKNCEKGGKFKFVCWGDITEMKLWARP